MANQDLETGTVAEWHGETEIPEPTGYVEALNRLNFSIADWSAWVILITEWPRFGPVMIPIYLLVRAGMRAVLPKRPLKADDDVLALMAQRPYDLEQFPVDVLYWRSGVPYGKDRGYITFVDDKLEFVGLSSEFLLSNQNVDTWLTTSIRFPRWRVWAEGPSEAQFRYKVDDHFGVIAVAARNEAQSARRHMLRYQFMRATQLWQKGDPAVGPDLAPPQTIQDSFRRRHMKAPSESVVLGSTSLILFLAAGFVTFSQKPDSWQFPLGLIVIYASLDLMTLSVLRGWRGWKAKKLFPDGGSLPPKQIARGNAN